MKRDRVIRKATLVQRKKTPRKSFEETLREAGNKFVLVYIKPKRQTDLESVIGQPRKRKLSNIPATSSSIYDTKGTFGDLMVNSIGKIDPHAYTNYLEDMHPTLRVEKTSLSSFSVLCVSSEHLKINNLITPKCS